ncbi:MAG: TRAP transporter large permease subunit, partial [Myxococcales bacterium]
MSGQGSVSRTARITFGVGATSVVGAIVAAGSALWAFVVAMALLGTPLFAVMGGAAALAWMTHKEPAQHRLMYLAPKILDTHFSDSPILVTIPLFTFVGYMLAEAKTPDRLVRAARAVLGWLPGGLAIVCVVASAVFTVLTGGSGVTIIAIGGLLYPSLRKQGYSDKFSLGLVTTGGSVGLLLPYSLPLLIFCLVASVDFTKAFKAVLLPGAFVVLLLSLYSGYVGTREGVPRERPRLREVLASLEDLKWELFIPVLLVLGLGSGLTTVDEAAGLVAFYTVVIEFFVYKDLKWKKDLPGIVKGSMSLAGAIILILSMANALVFYFIDPKVRLPSEVLDLMIRLGIEHRWQFLIVMNLFLLVIGMLMEGFSAILVSVPLILPFVADLGMRHPDEKMSPFQLAMIFLLNLEIAYCIPPLGLNLFIASFRFNRPVTSIYRVVMPFALILTGALVVVSYVPWLSDVLVKPDIAFYKEKSKREGLAPREAWMLECVQAVPNNPQPCSEEDRKNFPGGQLPQPTPQGGSEQPLDQDLPTPDAGCNPDLDDCDK